ncbi:MAG: hypothetical protein E7494_01765 [Ruminococcus albus]|jgi:hypothetical protein|nr:hypothetical protein [Ruminococcus albus]
MILKKLLAIMTAAVLAVCAAGCGKNTGKATKHYMAADYELDDPAQLDDWQINVLKSKGLPTDYNKLKIGQRDSIYRMGMMHRYLVDKYGIEFEYRGYYQSGFGQKEELIVMPEGADRNDSRSIVSVRVKNGEFSDNYGDYEVLMYIGNMYEEHTKEFFKSDRVKVYATDIMVNRMSNTNFEKGQKFDNNLSVGAVMFISGDICDDSTYDRFGQSVLDIMNEYELVGYCRVTVVSDDVLDNISFDNYDDIYKGNDMITDGDVKRDTKRSYIRTSIRDGKYVEEE